MPRSYQDTKCWILKTCFSHGNETRSKQVNEIRFMSTYSDNIYTSHVNEAKWAAFNRFLFCCKLLCQCRMVLNSSWWIRLRWIIEFYKNDLSSEKCIANCFLPWEYNIISLNPPQWVALPTYTCIWQTEVYKQSSF